MRKEINKQTDADEVFGCRAPTREQQTTGRERHRNKGEDWDAKETADWGRGREGERAGAIDFSVSRSSAAFSGLSSAAPSWWNSGCRRQRSEGDCRPREEESCGYHDPTHIHASSSTHPPPTVPSTTRMRNSDKISPTIGAVEAGAG